MGFDKVKIKQIRGLIIFIAVIVLLIIYSGSVLLGLKMFLGILTPFIAGGAIAFVLNIPLRFIETKIFKKWNGKVTTKIKRPISLVLSIIFVVAIITFVIITVVPKLQETFSLLAVQVPNFVKDVVEQLKALSTQFPQLAEWINQLEVNKIDWQSAFGYVSGFLSSGMTNVLSSAYSFASGVIGGVVNTFIAIIFAIYLLIRKEKLSDQGHRILTAYLPIKIYSRVEKVLALLYKNFSHFISGQCIEAVILGSMFFISMSILRFPYALLIGVLIAFLALIPMVGALIGCFLGAFLILMNDPIQAVWFVVLFLVLQQIEGNLIYPNVVGGSVGLPSIWVLFAVTIGGSLFGIVGMLCFIPIVSTIYALIRESVNERNGNSIASKNSNNIDSNSTNKDSANNNSRNNTRKENTKKPKVIKDTKNTKEIKENRETEDTIVTKEN